jgi:predicted alpha/beta-fold hydrolase
MSEIQLFPIGEQHIPESLTHERRAPCSPMRAFEPHPLLRNAHVATVAAAFWPRKLSRLPAATERLFEVEPGTRLLAKCHWQRDPQRHPTLVLIHGLEGSSESGYMLGIAEKGFASGFNILRMNQRNCGGTEHLTPTLYDAGLSEDYANTEEQGAQPRWSLLSRCQMQLLDSSGFSFCAASRVAVLTLFCYCADAGRTIPMISKPTITGLKNVLHTWQLSRSIDRPGPPDLSRQKHNGIRTAIKFVVGCNDSHLAQQLIRR